MQETKNTLDFFKDVPNQERANFSENPYPEDTYARREFENLERDKRDCREALQGSGTYWNEINIARREVEGSNAEIAKLSGPEKFWDSFKGSLLSGNLFMRFIGFFVTLFVSLSSLEVDKNGKEKNLASKNEELKDRVKDALSRFEKTEESIVRQYHASRGEFATRKVEKYNGPVRSLIKRASDNLPERERSEFQTRYLKVFSEFLDKPCDCEATLKTQLEALKRGLHPDIREEFGEAILKIDGQSATNNPSTENSVQNIHSSIGSLLS